MGHRDQRGIEARMVQSAVEGAELEEKRGRPLHGVLSSGHDNKEIEIGGESWLNLVGIGFNTIRFFIWLEIFH